jgi:hypothetical protein
VADPIEVHIEVALDPTNRRRDRLQSLPRMWSAQEGELEAMGRRPSNSGGWKEAILYDPQHIRRNPIGAQQGGHELGDCQYSIRVRKRMIQELAPDAEIVPRNAVACRGIDDRRTHFEAGRWLGQELLRAGKPKVMRCHDDAGAMATRDEQEVAAECLERMEMHDLRPTLGQIEVEASRGQRVVVVLCDRSVKTREVDGPDGNTVVNVVPDREELVASLKPCEYRDFVASLCERTRKVMTRKRSASVEIGRVQSGDLDDAHRWRSSINPIHRLQAWDFARI